MRFFILFLTGCIMASFIACHTATAAQARTSTPAADSLAHGDPAITQLPNGLTVLIKKDDRFPLVSLRLYVHAGSAYETKEEAGISHLLEHMVFKGTRRYPQGSIANTIEKSGGYLNAATSFDYTYYLTDMTSDNWKVGLDILKEMAFSPALKESDLTSEKDVVIAELKRGEDTPSNLLFQLSQKTALAGTPYEDPIIGYENTVRSITSQQMRNYINRLYQPQSMLLVICGNVNTQDALAAATKVFGRLKNSAPVVPPPACTPPSSDSPQTPLVKEGPWNKVRLGISIPVPHQNDIRSSQLDVLAQLLGGDATSRFYRTYKYEKRLVDSISVDNYSFDRVGMLYMQVILDAEKLTPFWQEFTKDLAGLEKATFTQQELDRAKLNIEDGLAQTKETLAGYASKLGHFYFFGKGIIDENNYLRSIHDTDMNILTNLIKQTFTPGNIHTVCLTPANTPLPENAKSLPDWLATTLKENWQQETADRQKEPDTQQTAGSDTEIIDLGNGRTLVLLPDTTLPYISAQIIFTGGDSLLTKETQGLGAFTASLLGKGTKDLSATAFEDYLSDRAATLSAASTKQFFTLNLHTPQRFSQDIFALMKKVLTDPALLDEEATRVRDNQIAAITLQEDQPTSLAFRRMFPYLFTSHSYSFMQLGEKSRVEQFSAKDAATYWEKQRQQPWVLSVCGSFDKAAVVEFAKSLPAPSEKPVALSAPDWSKDKAPLDLTLSKRKQAHFFMVFPTVGLTHEDAPGLELLETILSGQSGLLFTDLRDKQGLGYSVSAFSWQALQTGAMIFYIGTEPEKVDQAHKGFLKVIGQLHKKTLPVKEVERGISKMTGDYYREHQTMSSRASEAALLTAIKLPLDANKKKIARVKQITSKTLQQLAKKYLVPEQAYIIQVHP